MERSAAQHHVADRSKRLSYPKEELWTRRAERRLRRLPGDAQTRLLDAAAHYCAGGLGDVRKLTGRAECRMRVGDYRLLFIESVEAVTFVDAGHRRDIYREG